MLSINRDGDNEDYYRTAREYWRDKYMDLLEQYHKVMSQLEKIIREEKI